MGTRGRLFGIAAGLIVAWYLAQLWTGRHGSASNADPQTIEYRGQSVRLSKPYLSYEDYKDDPDNIAPEENARVAKLVSEAPIAKRFASREAMIRAVFALRFPGYGVGTSGDRPQSDGSVLCMQFITWLEGWRRRAVGSGHHAEGGAQEVEGRAQTNAEWESGRQRGCNVLPAAGERRCIDLRLCNGRGGAILGHGSGSGGRHRARTGGGGCIIPGIFARVLHGRWWRGSTHPMAIQGIGKRLNGFPCSRCNSRKDSGREGRGQPAADRRTANRISSLRRADRAVGAKPKGRFTAQCRARADGTFIVLLLARLAGWDIMGHFGTFGAAAD